MLKTGSELSLNSTMGLYLGIKLILNQFPCNYQTANSSSHIIQKHNLTQYTPSLEHNPKMADQYQISSIIFNYYLSLSSLISCSTSTCAGCFLAEGLFGLFLFPPFSSSKNPASSSSSGTNSSMFADECDHPFCGASIKMGKTSC